MNYYLYMHKFDIVAGGFVTIMAKKTQGNGMYLFCLVSFFFCKITLPFKQMINVYQWQWNQNNLCTIAYYICHSIL